MTHPLPFKPSFLFALRPARGLSTCLSLAALALLSACSKPAPPEEPVRAVKVIAVAMSNMTASAEFPGDVRARTESRLGFRVAGKLIKRQVELGQRVKAGQVLAQLDPQDYKLAADAARAQLSAAVTNRDVTAAEYKRFKDLKDQNFISAAELDRRDAALKAAQAQVDQAQAQLTSQGNQSAYTSLISDVAGVVTGVDAEVGQVVAAGTPVVRIAQDGPRDVVFSVPEDHVAAITLGSAVAVRNWTTSTSVAGTIREVAASADPVTRTYLVKAALADGTTLGLGSTAYVVPQALSRKGIPALKLPTSALKQEGTTSAVWVLDRASMTVRTQAIKIATVDGNEVVVGGGLEPGTLVVTAGVHVLSPGQKVTIFKEKETPALANPGQIATQTVAMPAPAVSAPAAK
jgi:multidrug efflux system membrane fusion protein